LSVLKTLTQEKTRDENIYQILHAHDVPDRLDALDHLDSYRDDFEVFQALKSTAFNDGFWAVRARATHDLAAMERRGTQELLFEIYQDKSSRVREAAIAGLSHFNTPEAAAFIESAALNDSSYVVLATCLRTMVAVDSTRATMLASRYADTESYSDMIRRTSLDVLRLTRDREAIPVGLKYCSPKYATRTRMSAIALLREAGKQDPGARESVEKLISDPNSSVRTSAVRTLHQWDTAGYRDLLSHRREIEKDEDVRKAIDDALGTAEGHTTEINKN
jgi:HEAT repeat protein